MLGRLANIVLMGLLPIGLTAPLAVSEIDFFFYSVKEEISVIGSLTALYESDDLLLFYLILCLSVIGPYLRLLLMTYAAFSSSAVALRIRPVLELVGRFSLIDIIIISLLVISFRVPEFKLQWGFYLMLSLWLMDMLASWSVWNRIRREDRLQQQRPQTPRSLEHRTRETPPLSPEPALEPEPEWAPAEVRTVAAAAPRGLARRPAAFGRPDPSSERG